MMNDCLDLGQCLLNLVKSSVNSVIFGCRDHLGHRSTPSCQVMPSYANLLKSAISWAEMRNFLRNWYKTARFGQLCFGNIIYKGNQNRFTLHWDRRLEDAFLLRWSDLPAVRFSPVSFALRPIGVFWIFSATPRITRAIGSSGHFQTDHFYITILLGPYAFSLCRFFADFSVACTSCRKWEFLHQGTPTTDQTNVRERMFAERMFVNAPTPCQRTRTRRPHWTPCHHAPKQKSRRATPEELPTLDTMNRPGRQHHGPNAPTPSHRQTIKPNAERRTDSREQHKDPETVYKLPNVPRIPGNDQKTLYTVRIH